MEERAVQQEKIEGSLEGGRDGGKADWKNECSLSSLLKHSCLLCWSSPRDTDIVETDERVFAKAAEIRVRRPQHLSLVCVCACLRECVGFYTSVRVCLVLVSLFSFWGGRHKSSGHDMNLCLCTWCFQFVTPSIRSITGFPMILSCDVMLLGDSSQTG